MIRAVIQARMSSTRFPGKVLAPLKGRPIIAHLLAQVKRVLPPDGIVVATSGEVSDDPLVCYVQQLGVQIFRGPLQDVFGRFQLCLKEYPCDWFFRLCADSPLLDSALLAAMLAYQERRDLDLVTNVYPRSFPKGCSVEMVNAATFSRLDPGELSPEQKEHVTKIYYDRPGEFRIVNVSSSDPSWAKENFAVDVPEDLFRLERSSRVKEGCA